MIRELDKRQASYIRGKADRQRKITDVARRVSKKRGMPRLAVARLNPSTATVAELRFSGGAPRPKAPATLVARDCVQATRSALGADPDDVVDFVPDPVVQRTSSGAEIVHLRQVYRGVPVFQMTRTVTFARDGRVAKVKGDHAPLPATFDTVPVVDAVRAVQTAGVFVTEPDDGGEAGKPSLPNGWAPKVVAAFALPSQPTVLDATPFAGKTTAHLVVFYQGPGARLGWYIQLTFPPTGATAGEQCEVVIGADKVKPKVLFCRRTAHPVVEGDVFERDPVSTPLARFAFPVPARSYDFPVPSRRPFPGDWCYGDETDGRNARAITEKIPKPARGTRSGSSVLFVSDDPENDDDQRRINSFYFCNYLHDFFELLGFDERAGNFEAGSATPTGAVGDPVRVVTHDRPLAGFAFMAPSPDGTSPTLGLGTYLDTKRHTGLDFTVVAHEYTHGVTQRLVGGLGEGSALIGPQSAGFAEGTSDLFALSIVNFFRLPANPDPQVSTAELQVIGAWFTGSPNGLRGQPYGPSYRGTYGNLGMAGYTEPHEIGALWCATMMEFLRSWYARSGKNAYKLCWRMVMDSLKAVNASPSFLDARDALEDALDLLHQKGPLTAADHKAVLQLFWKTFARFGMGYRATTNGPSLEGIVESFKVPPRVP
jgi:extracellular elastinolytic metalloproteinase